MSRLNTFKCFNESSEDTMYIIDRLAKTHLLDLIDVDVDVSVIDLNKQGSLFIKLNKPDFFLGFGAKDRLLENSIFPFIEMMREKYELPSIYVLENNISRINADDVIDIDYVLGGGLDGDFFYTIYIECKI